MLSMDERIRITFDVPERIRRALGLEAAGRSITVGEVIEQLVLENLPEALDSADRYMAEGKEPPRPRRGRKPKRPD